MKKQKRKQPVQTAIVMRGNKRRWAKGHSSDSNPSVRIHRDAARRGFYHPQNNDNELSSRDMKQLENMNLNFNDDDKGSGVSDADTVATKLSAITNCTNPTFDKVHRIWKSGSKLHTDILTVLSSVTDAIKLKGGKENEVEYFAALLNPLVDQEYSSNLVAATCYLLNLVIRKVPKPLLIQHFRRVSEIIYAVIQRTTTRRQQREDENDDDGGADLDDNYHASILRYSLSSLGVLLESHPSTVWASKPYNMSLAKIFQTILEYTVHEKPRVRRSAQKASVQIVLSAAVATSTLPAVVSESCAEFCVRTMERYGGGGGRGKRAVNNADAEATLHVLNLLQHILHRFVTSDLKRTTETIFKLMTLSDQLTSSTSVHCLYTMFRNRPSAVGSLSADLNAKIIMAIYDFQPSPKDGKAWSNWIQLATEAHANFLEIDLDQSADYVPKLIDVVARCLTNAEQSADVINAAANSMKKIYADFVPDMASPKCRAGRKMELLEQCLEALEQLLQGQYYTIWPHAFALFATFFQSTGSSVAPELKNFSRCLKTIAELRESESFPCKLPAEQAIGAAIRYVGPEQVLRVIPLGVTAETLSLRALNFPRSWLLPVLRMNIRGARISYFATYFLPLAIKIEQRVKELRGAAADVMMTEESEAAMSHNNNNQNQNLVEIKVLDALECQIWDLLPAFCNKPADVLDPITARALGAALIGRPKLRTSVLTGLRKLLQQQQKQGEEKVEEEDGTTTKNAAAMMTMAKYAGNYLNILLRLYVGKEDRQLNSESGGGVAEHYNEEGVRLAALQTIRAYLTVTPPELIGKYLDEVSKRLKQQGENDGDENDADKGEQNSRLMDILMLLVPYLADADQRRFGYELVVETNAAATQKRLQKKCWRVVEKLCGNSEFVSENLSILTTYLQCDLITAAPATKACRLRCLYSVLDGLQGRATAGHQQEDEAFVLSVLPDAMRCLQGRGGIGGSTSVKARKAAARFIVRAVTVMAAWRKDTDGTLRIIFDKLLIASASSSSPSSSKKDAKRAEEDLTSAITAIRLLCYEFRNDISTDLLSTVLGRVCGLLRSGDDQRRSVAYACVEFLKTFVGCFPEITVGQFLDTIVSAMCAQSDDCAKYCRRVTRKVMAKLVKRFSYVSVRKYVPPKYEKQLNNIRKLVARSEKRGGKKQRTTSNASSTDGDDQDETGTVFTSFTNLSRPETIADLLKDTSDEEDDEEDKEQGRRRGKRTKTPSSASVWLKEGGDEDDDETMIDLMDKKFMQQIVTSKPKQQQQKPPNPNEENDDDDVSKTKKNRGYKTAADGRLVITIEREDEEENEGMEKGVGNKGKRKRKRQDSVDSAAGEIAKIAEENNILDDQQQQEGTSTYVPGGRGIHRRVDSANDFGGGKRGAKRAKLDKKSSSKTGAGVDPYAYVPLDRRGLKKNKNRKQAKLGVNLKHLVQGAKKGASKGSKGRVKRQK